MRSVPCWVSGSRTGRRSSNGFCGCGSVDRHSVRCCCMVRGGAAGVCRGGLIVRRSMLRIDCAAMLAQGAASRNSLRAPSVRCAQTAAMSQMLRHACPSARVHAPCAALLAAAQIARRGKHLPRGRAAVEQPENQRSIRRPASRQRPVCPCAGAPLGRREAQRARPARVPKDTRASTSSLRQLFEQSERSERREFCRRAGSASSAGKSAQRADRPSEAPAQGHTGLCRAPALKKPMVTHQNGGIAQNPW